MTLILNKWPKSSKIMKRCTLLNG